MEDKGVDASLITWIASGISTLFLGLLALLRQLVIRYIDSEIDKLNGEYAALFQKVNSQDGKIERVDNKATENSKDIIRVSGKQEAIEDRVNRLENAG